MAEDERFSETTNAIARRVPCDAGTVRLYADKNLIECLRLQSGVRLFKVSAAAEVRAIREARMARSGNPRRRSAAA